MHATEQIERLVGEIESLPDPARSTTLALIQALMDFHGEALDRFMELVAEQGAAGYSLFDKFSRDELVSSLLLLYGLHPTPLADRVAGALQKVKPHLDAHGGSVEVLEISEGVVRLRLDGSCKGCPSSAQTLKFAIEEAIYAAAPDVVAIEAEGAIASTNDTAFVQIAGMKKALPIADFRLPI